MTTVMMAILAVTLTLLVGCLLFVVILIRLGIERSE